MKAIIDIQRQFFLDGDEADLKPMILKDIACLLYTSLIGVSHHFSSNERLTVGKSLVMLGDLSLDVVRCV